MSRWPTGHDVIEKLLTMRRLQAITGAQANGEPWLTKARRTLETAKHITDDDPESAYVLAYDAARHACTALLTQQGLRPTSTGGHYVIEEALRAQFGDHFKTFGTLRRRRNELEYPTYPGDLAEPEEAHEAIEHTQRIIAVAEKLLPNLGFFT
ncbi:MAG: HEPN domain-containing protein [Longispora sp.]|nr:HEPN domain-containing protein [Longispora sp. (in: high G+C Gram-positive bacteria)]